jgi:ABC-2 type transport system ATP-binding protein
VVESLRLLQRIYEVPEAAYRRQLAFFDELLGLQEFLHQPVRKLSLGQRMRCDLAAALLHSPRVLFLDEPTIGLDVVAKESVRTFLREARDQLGVTVILTTHDLGDIEQLCRRIIIIDHGKVLYDGLLADLRRGPGHRLRLCLDLAEPVTAAQLGALTADLPVSWDEADQSPGQPSHRHCAMFSRAETNAATILSRVLAVHRLRDMALNEPAIEDVVRRIYREGLVPAAEEAPVD